MPGRAGTREKCPFVVEACFVIEEWVSEVKVAMLLTVVKFHRHGVVEILLLGPDKPNQV
jgi:hypothetical protein